jgi:DNA (cytosine-5)-methyltransferase 1
MTKKLRHGSLFTGVGGVDLGLEWAGFETVWQVEIDPFARRVLEKHWPDVPKLTDVRECGQRNLEPVDIISGGFPCQQISCAGKREGIGTPDHPSERSGLWFECQRIITELRPRWVLIENVSRLLDTADGETVLDGLEEIGYSWWSRLIDAGALGAPHRRERTFILCHDDACGSCDFEAVFAETGALPPECQQRMDEALGRWNYWRGELGMGTAEGCPTITTTPTAIGVLEPHWPDGRVYRNGEGRWRKWTKRGTEGSASWAQEMLVRAVTQRNPRLLPTAGCCEDFMGFPRGWTSLAEEGTALPEELVTGWVGESDADAYARMVRAVRRTPHWRQRLGALGNAVVVQVPMVIGACIQRWESRSETASHAWNAGSGRDGWGGNVRALCVARPENSRQMSPVECRFETLGVERTKRVYAELNSKLEGLAGAVVRTMAELVPYLERMQRLLSQRGADRKLVLKRAGLPCWTEWAERYAASLHCSLRTIQRHIVLVRECERQKALGPGTAAEKKTRGVPKHAKLDARQQAALVEAHLAANELAAALRDGIDWETPLAKFEKVAVAPAVLEGWLCSSSRQPDWRTALVKLVDALEPCAGNLPDLAGNALRAAEALLGGRTGVGTVDGGNSMQALEVRPSAANPKKTGRRHGLPVVGCVLAAATQGVGEDASLVRMESKPNSPAACL